MKFMVHPDAFIIHVPHGKSAAQSDHDVALKKQAELLYSDENHPTRSKSGVRHRLRVHPGQDEAQAALAVLAPGAAQEQAQQRRALHMDEQPQFDHSHDQVDVVQAAKQHHSRVERLFVQFDQLMQRQEFRALQDPAAVACLRVLPWWKDSPVIGWSTDVPNQPAVDNM
jgi:hypothetical protein